MLRDKIPYQGRIFIKRKKAHLTLFLRARCAAHITSYLWFNVVKLQSSSLLSASMDSILPLSSNTCGTPHIGFSISYFTHRVNPLEKIMLYNKEKARVCVPFP